MSEKPSLMRGANDLARMKDVEASLARNDKALRLDVNGALDNFATALGEMSNASASFSAAMVDALGTLQKSVDALESRTIRGRWRRAYRWCLMLFAELGSSWANEQLYPTPVPTPSLPGIAIHHGNVTLPPKESSVYPEGASAVDKLGIDLDAAEREAAADHERRAHLERSLSEGARSDAERETGER